MRRRVGRVLRVGLLCFAIAVVLWFPASWFYIAGYSSQWPLEGCYIRSTGGAAMLTVVTRWVDPPAGVVTGPYLSRSTFEPKSFSRHAAWPDFEVSHGVWCSETYLSIPLWLLALICLAWPVTSFILARRKPKRGFPVEPKAGGEAVSPPLSSS